MSDGFLGRWARRKEAVREGKVVEDEPAAAVVPPEPPPQRSPEGEGSEAPSLPPPPPAPTLQDTESLTPTSDFTRFVARDVPPDVKNAALKKLFADPHFNVMDRLDTYIDDYGKPDPLPASWARQLASAKFLGLFEEKEAEKPHGDDADAAAPANVAQSDLCSELPSQPAGDAPAASLTDNADPDLRLQQDDAPGPPGPGQGSG